MDEWCSNASPCPCGCDWAMCGMFGEWVDRTDCDGCKYDTREERTDGGQEDE